MTRKKSKLPALVSVAHDVTYIDGKFTLFVDGAILSSMNKDVFNKVLERLGYKPVRITYNLLNEKAGPLVIDADTPLCCDVGSETYWSM